MARRSGPTSGKLISTRARSSRERTWSAIHARYLSGQPQWVLDDLLAAEERDKNQFTSLLYLYYCLRDRLTYDFVTEILWDMRLRNQPTVLPEDVLHLLDEKVSLEPQVRRWSESSRRKLASSILTSLRDFGVLQGQQRKTLAQPQMNHRTAKHMLRLMISKGAHGAAVIRDSAWRLFLLTPEDVAHLLNGLSQDRYIRFERTASAVILEVPPEWEVRE